MKFIVAVVLFGAVVAPAIAQNGGYSAPPQNGGFNGGSLNGAYSAPSGNGFGNGGFNGGGNGGFNGGSNGGAPGASYSAPSRNGNGNGNGGYGSSQDQLEIEALGENIPGGGIPGEDYPILSSVPETGFACEEQQFPGYYADTAGEAGCQVFHICQFRNGAGVQQDSFLCPNGSIFNQQYFVCDWWFNVDCAQSEQFYALNEFIGQEPDQQNGYGSAGGNGNGFSNGGSNGNGYGSSNGNGGNGNGANGYGSGAQNGANGNGQGFSGYN